MTTRKITLEQTHGLEYYSDTDYALELYPAHDRWIARHAASGKIWAARRRCDAVRAIKRHADCTVRLVPFAL